MSSKVRIMDHNENFFEMVYKNANKNDLSNIPWATMKPNVHLQQYLEQNKTPLHGLALVIGCGLGDDADALAKAGYRVDAIDISQTAIDIASDRFGHEAIDFFVADIFALPESMMRKYDFIFESRTIQSITPEVKERLIEIIATLVAPGGKLLLHANVQNDDESYGGPPWPLYRTDIQRFVTHGLEILDYSETKIDKTIAPYDSVVYFKKG